MKTKGNFFKELCKRWEFILFLILLAEFVIFGITNPKFLRPAAILNCITNYISICIIALFVTMVIITGGIDIQASSIVGLTSIVIGVLWSDAGVNIWVAVLFSLVVGGLCGALSGFLISYCGVQPMVVTLGGSFLYSGLALLVSGLSETPAYVGISGFPTKTEAGEFIGFRFLGKGMVFGVIPTQIVVYIILIAVAYWLLHKTKYGRKVFLIGVNQQAAEYSGINTRFIMMTTYMLSGVSASIAGVLLTANVDSAKYNLGANFTLSIITAVVLGGTLSTGGKGSIFGTVLASLVICILRYGLPLCFDVSPQNLDLPVGIMLIVVVVGREIFGQGMIKNLMKKAKKEK